MGSLSGAEFIIGDESDFVHFVHVLTMAHHALFLIGAQ